MRCIIIACCSQIIIYRLSNSWRSCVGTQCASITTYTHHLQASSRSSISGGSNGSGLQICWLHKVKRRTHISRSDCSACGGNNTNDDDDSHIKTYVNSVCAELSSVAYTRQTKTVTMLAAYRPGLLWNVNLLDDDDDDDDEKV